MVGPSMRVKVRSLGTLGYQVVLLGPTTAKPICVRQNAEEANRYALDAYNLQSSIADLHDDLSPPTLELWPEAAG